MLGLCYLTTQPDPGEAVTVVRMVTITSVLDTFTRCKGSIICPTLLNRRRLELKMAEK